MQKLNPTILYQKLIEHMNEAVWVCDKQERTVYANPACCRMLGYPLSALLGTLKYRFLDAESVKKVKTIVKADRRKGLTTSYEATFITRKGTKLPAFIRGTPLPDGGTMGIITDLSEIKTTESRYKQLIEHMNEAVYVTDKRGAMAYANPKFCLMMGYTLPKVLSMDELDFWNAKTAARIQTVNRTERRKGISSSYEGMLVTDEGEEIPALVSGTPLPDGGTIGIITDLRELKHRESVYYQLVEHMNEAVWMMGPRDRTVYVNPKFCEISEYTLDELKGKSTDDFWDEKSRKKIAWANEHERKKGISSSYEGTLITKSGKLIPMLISGTPLQGGGTMGIMVDLSELKKREAKERVLSSAITYANDAIIIMDAKGRVESWNKGAKIIFGYKEREILGKSLLVIFTREDLESLLKNTEVRYNFQLHGKHKNRQTVIVSTTLTPVEGNGAKANTFCLLIARDITTQHKFDEELAVKYQKLRDAYNQFGVIRRQMDYVFELIELCSVHSSPRLLGDFIVSAVIMLTRVDACSLRLHNPKKGTLEILATFGLGEEWYGKSVIPYKDSLAKRAFEGGGALKIIDVTREPKYHSKHLARKSNLISIMVIPLVHRGELLGSLNLYAGADRKLEIFENEFIEKFAEVVAVALATNA